MAHVVVGAGGMVDEQEHKRMMDIMQRRLQTVCRRGPKWRRPQVRVHKQRAAMG